MTREYVRDEQRLDTIVQGLGSGIVLVDTRGEVRWMDQTARQSINGELRRLPLPLDKSEGAVECFIMTVQIPVNGHARTLSIVQEIEPRASEASPRDLHPLINAAVQDVLSDTTWLAKPLSEKLRAWCQVTEPGARNHERDHNLAMLTPREREILGLTCEDRSDTDMSRLLKLSRNTVRNHVASIFGKIGVNRRSAAVIWARERGITCRD